MSERPDFERVLAEHHVEREHRCYPEYECSCGWKGSDGDNDGPNDGENDSQAGAEAHLAAALSAEVARWLADEGTRERVARAFGQEGATRQLGSTVPEWHASLAATALAALAPTADEGGAR